MKIYPNCNCAWNADDIDSILSTLEKNNIKITFFIVGDWAGKYPEAVKKISEAGHEIANHSNKHPHVNKLSYEENMKEIKECSEKIKEITGNETTLYRAPYGEYNNTVIKAAKEQGHLAIQWNLDTLDYTGITGNEMWQKLESKLSNGSIILTHNGTKHTADSLEMLIKNIMNKGFKIVKVSELLYKENYIIDNNGAQKLVNV
ncbi:MAG: polysaccharide deacetylase family protein [Clostridia bacterium]|nr:deacetylase [Clostridiales bacterium]